MTIEAFLLSVSLFMKEWGELVLSGVGLILSATAICVAIYTVKATAEANRKENARLARERAYGEFVKGMVAFISNVGQSDNVSKLQYNIAKQSLIIYGDRKLLTLLDTFEKNATVAGYKEISNYFRDDLGYDALPENIAVPLSRFEIIHPDSGAVRKI